MKQAEKYIISVVLIIFVATHCIGQTLSCRSINDSIHSKKKPFLALGEIATINMGVWAFDRYVTQSDFARINWGTIKRNFKTGFVWDGDQLGTNFILHPYHGSLYFNAARSCGYNYYQSIPFTLFGSSMWEWFLEDEPPSINDLLSTTFVGSMYGEILYRISDRVLSYQTTGANRVLCEVLATLVSPIHQFNRFISKDYRKHYKPEFPSVTIDFSTYAGVQWLEPEIGKGKIPYAMISFKLDYNPDMNDVELPFDWFSIYVDFCTGHGSFYVNKMSMAGLLWNKPYHLNKGGEWGVGVYQHYNYWDSPVRKYQKTPYRFSQVLALGPGVYYKSKPQKDFLFVWRGYLNAIGLGAALSDHYWADMRDYNFGSGASAETNIYLSTLNNRLRMNLVAGNYTLFTWKGYGRDRDLYKEHPKQLDAQGDPGYTNFTSVEASLGYWSKYNWNICFQPEFIRRHTHYKYYPSTNYSTWNLSVKVGYTL